VPAAAASKRLPKSQRWSARQARHLLRQLDRRAFTQRTDDSEAVTAGVIGQRWEAVSAQQGYDTAKILSGWLGEAARPTGDADTLFDAKTQKDAAGSSDKATERANKAAQFNEWRASGKEVMNGVIFHTKQGVFFQPGIDHGATTPRFRTARRPIIAPQALAPVGRRHRWHFARCSVNIHKNLAGIRLRQPGARRDPASEADPRQIFTTVIAEVGMEKVQRHLDAQAKQAVAREMSDEERLAEMKWRGLVR